MVSKLVQGAFGYHRQNEAEIRAAVPAKTAPPKKDLQQEKIQTFSLSTTVAIIAIYKSSIH